MTIEWLAGNRLRGTTAERPAFGLQSPSAGGWVELGRTTLGSTGDDITVSSLSDKRYYMVLASLPDTGQANQKIRLGYSSVDSGSNYSWRASTNGGGDSTSTSDDHMNLTVDAIYDTKFSIGYLSNLSSKEKLTQWWTNERTGVGAGSPPVRKELVGKWTNTSNPLDVVNFFNSASGSFVTGAEVVVLGWDPADTHTSNFWEELDSTTTTTSGTIQSGTFTAKKYLMYQIVGKKASGTGTEAGRFQFNGDTGSNYAQRNSINGTDYTYTSQSSMNIGGDGNTAGEMVFLTGFIINNTSTEKLLLGHSAFGNTAGAGQIGNRGEIACKWANTSAQITSIECMGTTFESGAIMKIWGAD